MNAEKQERPEDVVTSSETRPFAAVSSKTGYLSRRFDFDLNRSGQPLCDERRTAGSEAQHQSGICVCSVT